MTAALRRAGDAACVAVDRGLGRARRAGGLLALPITPTTTDRELAAIVDLAKRVVEARGRSMKAAARARLAGRLAAELRAVPASTPPARAAFEGGMIFPGRDEVLIR